jgi:hypothetical protein
MAWDTPSVNRSKGVTTQPSSYRQPAVRISFARVLWVMACAVAVGVLFGWIASLVLACTRTPTG